jgi:hypothetical protein
MFSLSLSALQSIHALQLESPANPAVAAPSATQTSAQTVLQLQDET